SRVQPHVGGTSGRLDSLGRTRAELLGHSLRPDVLGMDERDDPLALDRLPSRAGGFRRVPVAPVTAENRPAELCLGMVAGEVVRRGLPRSTVPHEEADPPDQLAVELDDELSDAVALPAPQPK